jgi:hypothetical protein
MLDKEAAAEAQAAVPEAPPEAVEAPVSQETEAPAKPEVTEEV